MTDGATSPGRAIGSYQGWRRFFLVSGLWNLSGSIPVLIAPSLNLKLFYGLVSDDYYHLFLNRGLWWAVLIFGVGYLIAAWAPGRHLGIIVMGVLGKTVIAIHWFYLFSIDRATILALLAALGDSLFTVGFLLYLFFGPRD
ncbi:MAG TPA: hypothetical protein VM658_19315 [bacterium]|nr:hypothetical protein [bacterium]